MQNEFWSPGRCCEHQGWKRIALLAVLSLCVCTYAQSLTGSNASETLMLETVSPFVTHSEATDDNRIVAEFSESMRQPGVMKRENYLVSGPGVGTLMVSPDMVSGTTSLVELNWEEGEMCDGSPVTLSLQGLQDIVGNPLLPSSTSPVITGKGTPPSFSEFMVIPPEASSEQTVTIRFSTSETLANAPRVIIRGNTATFSSLVGSVYVYHYRVRRGDTSGPADIRVSGRDVAGNAGVTEVSGAFKIVDNPQEMPLSWFLPACVLLVFGVVLLRRRKRLQAGAVRILFLCCLWGYSFACDTAAGQAPVVSNVTVSQSPDDTSGTRVDVHFDLIAPGAPCDIVLSLSKDGGADGYSYEMGHYYGNVADVTTGRDRHIVWNIRADYPEEYMPAARILVTASDEPIEHSVQYLVEGHGAITGAASQTVGHGEDGLLVTATPETGYHFAGWSDGVKTADRQETSVTGDVSVTALFEIDVYTITCTVVGSGTCTAEPSRVPYGGTSSVSVTPSPGWYVFSAVDSEEGGKAGSYTTTPITGDRTVVATFAGGPSISSFVLDAGAETASRTEVSLDTICPETPLELLASESPDFAGAVWQSYQPSIEFKLSGGVGVRTVYVKVRNPGGESEAASDSIFLEPETVPVDAGKFDMGRTSVGDDAAFGTASELPVHEVTLAGYDIAKYQITNGQYCDVLNWALTRGYLRTGEGDSWNGSGEIYGGPQLYILVDTVRTECNIAFAGGKFVPKNRTGVPGTTLYSMETHPMVAVSWYGSVAFCNWLSEWQGLNPCYDVNTAQWPLSAPPASTEGYRLPTEAEWERAAAWDGTKHWIYGFTSDTLADDRCNYGTYPYGPYVNPLGLTEIPYTSPVGWFNGINVSPNGGAFTVDSPSPVGAYDMSGNVWEWCHDWYASTYYTGGTMINPTGPATGATKVLRGGAFRDRGNTRTACRDSREPDKTPYWRGFRIARTR